MLIDQNFLFVCDKNKSMEIWAHLTSSYDLKLDSLRVRRVQGDYSPESEADSNSNATLQLPIQIVRVDQSLGFCVGVHFMGK